MLWAVANTLTVFAIRDVGLAIAFPIWNTNTLIGILWGRLLFGELKGASPRNVAKVVLGASAIVAAAILLGFSTLHPSGLHGSGPHATRAASGILAALGASLLWGTMYVPYRKAYLSGMNPLSFVTIFTLGELATVLLLALTLDPDAFHVLLHSSRSREVFWLFLGGFVWVIGDIFQQYATKYLGIGRAIPLSNTNQLWGLAWGALVFGELAHADLLHRTYVVAGSVVMILGALAVSTAIATEREHASTHAALHRECDRYDLDRGFVLAAYLGVPPASGTTSTAGDSTHAQSQSGFQLGVRFQSRAWWDLLIVAAALALFIALGLQARIPSLPLNLHWTAALTALLILTAATAAYRLWSQTRFE
jgi:glucose uptake protein GlcU